MAVGIRSRHLLERLVPDAAHDVLHKEDAEDRERNWNYGDASQKSIAGRVRRVDVPSWKMIPPSMMSLPYQITMFRLVKGHCEERVQPYQFGGARVVISSGSNPAAY